MDGDLYPKHLFICTLMAYKPDQSLPDILIVAAAAEDLNGALAGKGELNLQQHPATDGWIEHREYGMQVPDALIATLANQPRAGTPGSMIPAMMPDDPVMGLPFDVPMPNNAPPSHHNPLPLPPAVPLEPPPGTYISDPNRLAPIPMPVMTDSPFQMPVQTAPDDPNFVAAVSDYVFW